jgi:hypothetical protein
MIHIKSNNQYVNNPETEFDAVAAVAVAKKLYKSPAVRSVFVWHQTGTPIFYRTKEKGKRGKWVN